LIDQAAFLAAYVRAVRRGTRSETYQPRPLSWFTVKDALRRLGLLLGSMPDWTSLEKFLPDSTWANPLQRRAAMSSTLIAGLEMARGGELHLRQDQPFGPILVGRRDPMFEGLS
jgi:segregation and condensation protein A